MPKKIDLIGKNIGKIHVLQEISTPYKGIQKKRKTIKKLKCRCECGNIFYPFRSNVIAGHTKGCLKCSHADNLVGKKIGKIEFIERFWNPNVKYGHVHYKVKCECGNISMSRGQTAKRLKGIQCPACPRKEKPIPFEESIKITNFKKHLRAKDRNIGRKSGRLKCLRFFEWENKPTRRRALYEFKCKCGNKIIRRGDIFDKVFSCGCLQKERTGQRPKILSHEEILMIRELLRTKIYKGSEIGKMFNVDEWVISNIKLNKIYKSIL